MSAVKPYVIYSDFDEHRSDWLALEPQDGIDPWRYYSVFVTFYERPEIDFFTGSELLLFRCDLPTISFGHYKYACFSAILT